MSKKRYQVILGASLIEGPQKIFDMLGPCWRPTLLEGGRQGFCGITFETIIGTSEEIIDRYRAIQTETIANIESWIREKTLRTDVLDNDAWEATLSKLGIDGPVTNESHPELLDAGESDEMLKCRMLAMTFNGRNADYDPQPLVAALRRYAKKYDYKL